jgi:hypothetical protein
MRANQLRYFLGSQCHAEWFNATAAAMFGLVGREAVIISQVIYDWPPHPQTDATAVQENDAWGIFGAGGLEGK